MEITRPFREVKINYPPLQWDASHEVDKVKKVHL